MGTGKRNALIRVSLSVSILLWYVATSYAQQIAQGSKQQFNGSRSKLLNRNIAFDSTTRKERLFSVLKRLNDTRGVYFLYSNSSFGEKLVEPVADVKQPIEVMLAAILKNSGLHYQRINQNTFVIIEQATPLPGTQPYNLPDDIAAVNQEKLNDEAGIKNISGIVTATNGFPLSGVSISIRGTNNGTTSNTRGEFSIECSKGDVLEFTYVGYQKKDVLIDNSNTHFFNTSLSLIEKQMTEVVVTALGVRRDQRALGYSVNTIKDNDLTASGNTNFASALYGKSPGIRITTSPGGATSAVQVQVRGLNSLNFNTQPLYVVDGVVIRNTNEKGIEGVNNDGYWGDPRIRGNGILDINPSDIETLTILKGASATALYGSEAASGVVVITTKRGTKKQGIGVEVNYTATVEQAAFLPKYQNIYGPGYDRAMNLAEGATEEGWIPTDTDGNGTVDALRPNFKAYAQFGPKMEGQMVPWWDGVLRPYRAQPDNYKNLYRTGFNSIVHAAVANQTEKVSFRFAYTRNDYRGIQVGGDMKRNTFNLNTSFKVNNKVTTDVIVSFVNSKVHNRPLQLNRILASYTGFFSRAEDMGVMFEKYKTQAGYKYVPWDQPQRNPTEAFRYMMKNETLDMLWTQLRNSENENQNRLLTSVTINYDIAKNLRLRGRIGNDLTNLDVESKQFNEYPIAYNVTNSTGLYGISSGRYSIIYGDALLTYSKKIKQHFSISLNGGYQVKDERYNDQSSTTNGGLAKENWFSLENSFGTVTAKNNQSAVFKYALLGFFNVAYKNFLFLETTGRKEYSSTLPPEKNSYFYPSVNAGFVLTDAWHLPKFINYAKIRASYGVVGNAPPPYVSAITYTQTILATANGPVPSLSAQWYYGNNKIRPENKHESELGLEAMFLRNRLSIDLTVYRSNIVDQVLQSTVPTSTGANFRLVNGGDLQSTGMEVSLQAIPLANKNMKWTTRLNFALSTTKVRKLTNGVQQIIFYDAEQSAIRIVAEEGETVGNIYVYPHLTDAKGNYIVDANGLYVMDNSRYEKAGNVMPKLTGGLSNTFSYKNWSIDIMADYRFGGQIISPALKYNIGAGMYESTLQYRDAEHGGLPYYINKDGAKIGLPSHQSSAPDGGKVYHDGLVLKGVNAAGQNNTKIVDAAYYYYNMFMWGAGALNKQGAVYDNSYVKLRELVMGYELSEKFAQKIKFKTLKVSLIGRNLFYFWRTLKNLDPEAPIGSSWSRQSTDDGTMAATRSFGFSLNMGF